MNEMAAPSAGQAAARRIESPICQEPYALRLRCVGGDALLRQGGPADSMIQGSVPDSYRCSASRGAGAEPKGARHTLPRDAIQR